MNKKNYYEYLETQKDIKLNLEQKAAVNFNFGNALVLSTAGSGKTTVIVSRTGRLLYEGICKNKILTITFSKMAADDMKARFQKVFNDEYRMKVDFSTIHSFLYKIVRDYCNKKNKSVKIVENSYKIIENIIKNIYSKDYYSTVNEEEIENIISKISYVKNMMLTYDDIDKSGIEIKNFREIVIAYDKYKQDNKMLDFDDMLIYGYKILTNVKGYCDSIKKTYDFIQIDEMQDTSKIQHAIIRLIQNDNLFMVGDDDQSIYSFRGSFPEYMLNFKEEYSNGTVFYLSNNYRSDGHIVGIAKSVVENNKDRYHKAINAMQNMNNAVKIVKVASRSLQNKYILDDLKNIKEETVGILYRNNISSLMIASGLYENKIDFYIKDDKTKFFKSFVLQDISCFIRLAKNPRDKEAFSKIYYKSYTYFSKNINRFVQNYPEDKPVFEILKKYPDIEYYMIDRINNFKYDIEQINCIKPNKLIQHIKMDLEYYDYLMRLDEEGRNSITSTSLILDILDEISKYCRTIDEFVIKINNLKDILFKASQNKNAQITLSSIHSSKGLEYDIVYMIDNIDKEFPPERRNETLEEYEKSLEEERRVFYVGLTRAKKKLVVIAPKSPSLFVKEIIK